MRAFVLPVAIFSLALAASPADAWTRSSSATGGGGRVWNHNASGACAGGSCTRSGGTVGPRGGVWGSSGSVTRTAPGQVSRSGMVTGPRGASYGYSGSRSCAGGTCMGTRSWTRQ